MVLIPNSELVLPRERERLAAAQARQAAGLADETFSGQLADDKDPETAYSTNNTAGAPGPGSPRTGLRPGGGDPSHFGTREPGNSSPSPTEDPGQNWWDDKKPGNPYEDPTKWSHDTVGAVALDGHGNLAAATSTGGTLNKTPGRVGDSSLIGCGCYADNLAGAVSLTGWGEPIMKLVLGKWATDRVAAGSAPEIAAREAISYLYNRLGGHGGIILLGPEPTTPPPWPGDWLLPAASKPGCRYDFPSQVGSPALQASFARGYELASVWATIAACVPAY